MGGDPIPGPLDLHRELSRSPEGDRLLAAVEAEIGWEFERRLRERLKELIEARERERWRSGPVCK